MTGRPSWARWSWTADAYNQEQTRRAVVELPTGTLKRFVIPVFAAPNGLGSLGRAVAG